MRVTFLKRSSVQLRVLFITAMAAVAGCTGGGGGGVPVVITDPVLLGLDGIYDLTPSNGSQVTIAGGLFTSYTENGSPLALQPRSAAINGSEITWKSVFVLSDPSLPFSVDVEINIRVTDQGGGTLTGVIFSSSAGGVTPETQITLQRQ